MKKTLKKDIETLKDSFSEYQVMIKVIEKSSTLITMLSKYYNLLLDDEECNDEYYRDDYSNGFDVKTFEAKVIDKIAELLIVLHVLMLYMDSKKRVQNDMKLIARRHTEAVLRKKDGWKGV